MTKLRHNSLNVVTSPTYHCNDCLMKPLTLVWAGRGLTERKAWMMSALMELSGLSLITTKICSSFSRLMKFPNQERLASLEINKRVWVLYSSTSLWYYQTCSFSFCPFVFFVLFLKSVFWWCVLTLDWTLESSWTCPLMLGLKTDRKRQRATEKKTILMSFIELS